MPIQIHPGERLRCSAFRSVNRCDFGQWIAFSRQIRIRCIGAHKSGSARRPPSRSADSNRLDGVPSACINSAIQPHGAMDSRCGYCTCMATAHLLARPQANALSVWGSQLPCTMQPKSLLDSWICIVTFCLGWTMALPAWRNLAAWPAWRWTTALLASW